MNGGREFRRKGAVDHTVTVEETLPGKAVTDQHNFEMAFGTGRYIVTIAFINNFEEHGFKRCP